MAKVFAATDAGRVRASNEDSVLSLPGVALVADGMGGEAAGEVASGLAAHTIRVSLGEAVAPYTEETLRRAVEAANTAVYHEAQATPACAGMGTTVTLCAYQEAPADAGTKNVGVATYAHVGDSRLYLYRDGAMRQLTRDHSYVEELVARGTLTEAEARVHPKKNVLTRAVGTSETVKVDTGWLELFAGDILLLATDGLTNMVTEEEIGKLLAEPGESPADALIAAANTAGGRDNVSAVVVIFP